jgi:hypothetical protein
MTASRPGIVAALIVLFAFAAGAAAEPLLGGNPSPQLFAQQSSRFTPESPFAPTCGPYCATFEGGTTPTEQGSGSTCTNAQSSLTTQLRDIANSDCRNNQSGFNSCNLVITYTETCVLVGGAWQVKGYATYNCRETTC